MLDALLLPLYAFAFPGFCVGAVAPVWGCVLAAECFSVASLGFIYVIGGSLLNDEISFWRFLGFLPTSEHFMAFILMGTPILAGRLVRQWLRTSATKPSART